MNYTSKAVYEYISEKTNDPIVEWKICEASGKEFAVYQSDMEFYDKISPTFDGRKFQIPTPRLCPEERQRRRLLRRNERKLYKTTCAASGGSIISNYSPDKNIKVYAVDQWYKDSRSATDYGIGFDTSKSVFDHVSQVITTVPNIALMVNMNENCHYVNGCGNSKNCYLVFDTDYCEDSYYSDVLKKSSDIVDSSHVYYSQDCYNCINCTESSRLISCYECDASSFLINCSLCSGCRDCYGCTNLVNQQYCINNEQVTKEEWKIFIENLDYSADYPVGLQRATYKVNDEGGFGNNLYGSKNCLFSYNIGFSENLKYCELVTDCHNSQDLSSFGGEGTEWSYDSVSVGMGSSRIFFSAVVTRNSSNLWYSYAMVGCKNCFGCSHMVNAEYCIFNKQYTKEAYEKTVAQIIEKMIEEGTRGEFFDPSVSPFGYNETIVMDYFPATKKEALNAGWNWSEYEYHINLPENAPTINPKDFSDEERKALRDDDGITNKIIVCELSGKPFRIIKQELVFYRKHDLPLPIWHPDIRHQERIKKRPSRTLYLRTCDKTGEKMLSVYSEACGFDVYSEEAYMKEFYS